MGISKKVFEKLQPFRYQEGEPERTKIANAHRSTNECIVMCRNVAEMQADHAAQELLRE